MNIQVKRNIAKIVGMEIKIPQKLGRSLAEIGLIRRKPPPLEPTERIQKTGADTGTRYHSPIESGAGGRTASAKTLQELGSFLLGGMSKGSI